MGSFLMESTSCRAARVRVGRTESCVRPEKECPLCGGPEERGRVCPGEGRASCGERENRAECALGKAVPRVENVRTEPCVLWERPRPCGEQEQSRVCSGKGHARAENWKKEAPGKASGAEGRKKCRAEEKGRCAGWTRNDLFIPFPVWPEAPVHGMDQGRRSPLG